MLSRTQPPRTQPHTNATMSLIVEKINCDQQGNSYIYDLDTKLFDESVFKSCTKCNVFVTDLSHLFCNKCKNKLDYVNVSNMEMWINFLNFLKFEARADGGGFGGFGGELKDDLHTHEDNNDDCLDCSDCAWEEYTEESGGSGGSEDVEGPGAGFYSTYFEESAEVGAEGLGTEVGLGTGVEDEWKDDEDYDEYDGYDSTG